MACSKCGSNDINGKICDCEPKLLVSKSYIIGIDISSVADVTSVMQVTERDGLKTTVINTIYGRPAERLYEELTDSTIKSCANYVQSVIDNKKLRGV